MPSYASILQVSGQSILRLIDLFLCRRSVLDKKVPDDYVKVFL